MAVQYLLHFMGFLACLSLTMPATAAAVRQLEPEPEVKPSDTDVLTIFRHGADAHGILAANWSTGDACAGRWTGVSCSADSRRVTSLSLPSLDLRGPLDPLSHLGELRALDLRGNRLNGTLDKLLLGVPNLVLLDLSHNDLSGAIPAAIKRLPRLIRVDLADNSLRGPIPAAALVNLTGLLTLKLQDNLLTGLLPDISAPLPRLAEFNASNNQLSGRVPDAMRAKFGLASFAGNAGLCGPAPSLPPCSFLPHEPAPTSPSSVPSSSSQSVVPSNPAAASSSSVASSSPALATPESLNGAGKGGLSTGAIAGIAVGNALFVCALMSLLVACCCCSQGSGSEPAKKRKRRGRVGLEDGDGELFGHLKVKQPARPGSVGRCSDGGDSDGARSKLVFFGVNGECGEDDDDDDGGSDSSSERRARGGLTSTLHQQRRSRFELEELLRASAEMVGRGSLGTVYRAVLGDGRMVAVKRLRDTNPCPREEFHRYMDLIGRLRHPHLVPLRSFYYAKQEKLLIYDYLPSGNLHDCLHGHQMSGESPLDWTTRVRLLLGAARGLACIHREYRMSSVPHGNIKSSNVLLDKDGAARVADFGLALLLSPAHAIARLGGYMAPEQSDNKRLSQEADVYSFGVLVLEALTGKVPAQHLQPLPDADVQMRGKKSVAAVSLPEWVRSVVREEWTAEVFDVELLRYRNIEEEMVAMLHVALACVAQQPEQRPSMADVVRMIESVPVDQSPLPEGRDVSVTSPSISITTDDGDGRLSY
ncbi:leucine-rich repeat receptor-like protein kinase PXC1 [Phragmites australis]|uniref:leucine-rich repeat receptor-like protein kinase PXC1 n=1 Tax=Phragmites australis TaxID=29695 RepID=UPI002D78F146|nr:leucine-rich repeat receptor-like protein kinase PXC1 [Phragmites australis]